MITELFRHPDGSWEVACGALQWPIASGPGQASADRLMDALGVPVISPVDNEQAVAGAERAYFGVAELHGTEG